MADTIIVERTQNVDSEGVPAAAGQGYAPDGFTFCTLEPKALMAVPGRYRLGVRPMSHSPAMRVEILGAMQVDGTTLDGGFLHSINRASESKGCIGVGSHFGAPGLLLGGISDRVADKLAELVQDVLKADGEAWIEIKDLRGEVA